MSPPLHLSSRTLYSGDWTQCRSQASFTNRPSLPLRLHTAWRIHQIMAWFYLWRIYSSLSDSSKIELNQVQNNRKRSYFWSPVHQSSWREAAENFCHTTIWQNQPGTYNSVSLVEHRCMVEVSMGVAPPPPWIFFELSGLKTNLQAQIIINIYNMLTHPALFSRNLIRLGWSSGRMALSCPVDLAVKQNWKCTLKISSENSRKISETDKTHKNALAKLMRD